MNSNVLLFSCCLWRHLLSFAIYRIIKHFDVDLW